MDETTNQDDRPKVDPEVHRVEVHRSEGDDRQNRQRQPGDAGPRRRTVRIRVGNGPLRVHVPLWQLILGGLTFLAIIALLGFLFIALLPVFLVIAAIVVVAGLLGGVMKK